MEQSAHTKKLRLYAAGVAAEADRFDARMDRGRVGGDGTHAGALQALAWMRASVEAAAVTLDELALQLHDEHGASVREIAVGLGLSVGATHRMLGRARDLGPEGGWSSEAPGIEPAAGQTDLVEAVEEAQPARPRKRGAGGRRI